MSKPVELGIEEFESVSSGGSFTHCRCQNDHNTAHKFLGRCLDIVNGYAMEVDPEGIGVPEIAHACHGSEFLWWTDDKDPDKPLFRWCWQDFIRNLTDDSKKAIFGDTSTPRYIIGCVYVALPNKFGPLTNISQRLHSASYHQQVHHKKDMKKLFVFVMSDKTCISLKPSWDSHVVEANDLSLPAPAENDGKGKRKNTKTQMLDLRKRVT